MPRGEGVDADEDDRRPRQGLGLAQAGRSQLEGARGVEPRELELEPQAGLAPSWIQGRLDVARLP